MRVILFFTYFAGPLYSSEFSFRVFASYIASSSNISWQSTHNSIILAGLINDCIHLCTSIFCTLGFADKLGAPDTGILKYYHTDQVIKPA